MPELRVVAVSNDGSRLVLKAADSTEYFLPIDERLRAAVRGDRPRLGQIDVESHLRPRDIQARIRAGASAEEVAQLAGISVERVRRFEGPVLAERAFMAERARKTPVRRQGEATGPQLGDVVGERLLLRGADRSTVVWDSFQRDDRTWEVLLDFSTGGEVRQARWTYDPPRRLVQPLDDEARALIGETPERAVPAVAALPAEEPTFPFVPRIARLHNGERQLTDRGLGMRPHAPERPPVERVERVERVDRVDRIAPVEREPVAASAAASASASADVTSLLDVVSVVSEVDAAAEPEAPVAAAGAGAAYADVLMPRTASPHRDRLIGSTDRQAEADGVRPGRRAAVPSWDEIVFGTRRKKQD